MYRQIGNIAHPSARAQSQTQTCTHTDTRTRTHARMHAQAGRQAGRQARAHAGMQARTHARTRTQPAQRRAYMCMRARKNIKNAGTRLGKQAAPCRMPLRPGPVQTRRVHGIWTVAPAGCASRTSGLHCWKTLLMSQVMACSQALMPLARVPVALLPDRRPSVPDRRPLVPMLASPIAVAQCVPAPSPQCPRTHFPACTRQMHDMNSSKIEGSMHHVDIA